MTDERIPVHIRMWVKGTRIDSRAWLDEFKIVTETVEGPPYGNAVTYAPTGRRDITLVAHTDKPWKFHRGKPVVEEAS